jgi:hypothetical protein
MIKLAGRVKGRAIARVLGAGQEQDQLASVISADSCGAKVLLDDSR